VTVLQTFQRLPNQQHLGVAGGSLRKEELLLIGRDRLVGYILRVVHAGVPTLLDSGFHGAHQQLLLLAQLLLVNVVRGGGLRHDWCTPVN
jgi:hypothetical protein